MDAQALATMLGSSLGTAAAVAMILQWLKRAPWFPYLSTDPSSARMNQAASWLGAFVSTIGLHFAWKWQGTPDGAFSLTIVGSVANLYHGIMHVIAQFLEQHGFYKWIVAPAEIQGDARQLLKDILTELQKPQTPPVPERPER